MPLLPLYLLRRSVVDYVLLTAFDLSLGLMLIVGTTRDRTDPTSVDPRSRWLVARIVAILVLARFLGGVAAIVAVPIGMPALLVGVIAGEDVQGALINPGFWLPVAAMALLTGVRAQLTFEATTAAGARGAPSRALPVIGDLAEDRKRSLAAYAAQVTLIATFVALCCVLIGFGRPGLYTLPILYATLLVFYDARPDIGQRILPELWQRR